MMHYLDDFLLIGTPNMPECADDMGVVLQVFERLGILIPQNKLEGPTRLSFFSFQMDPGAMEIRLSQEKVQELQKLLAEWSERRSCRKKKLESLVGKPAHPCEVIQPGKPLLQDV